MTPLTIAKGVLLSGEPSSGIINPLKSHPCPLMLPDHERRRHHGGLVLVAARGRRRRSPMAVVQQVRARSNVSRDSQEF